MPLIYVLLIKHINNYIFRIRKEIKNNNTFDEMCMSSQTTPELSNVIDSIQLLKGTKKIFFQSLLEAPINSLIVLIKM